MGDFKTMNQPPLSPPGWIFPIVWTVLYLLMGYAAYRVQTSGKDPEQIRKAVRLYGVQLLLNFLWSPVFFGLHWYLVAFFILVALWVMIYLTMLAFSRLDETAGDLLIPYILWVTFAGYLNLGVYLLN
jgi:tryptophan-rich sensory protein